MKAHVWVESKQGGFCERCGKDKPIDPKKAKVRDCRPTRIFGL